MIKKMTASDTNSVGKKGVPVSYRGGGGGVNPRYSLRQQ